MVVLHHGRGDIAVARLGVGGHRGRLGEGLEAELAAETVVGGAVPLERLFAMPDRPEVSVARVGVVVVGAIFLLSSGRCVGIIDDLNARLQLLSIHFFGAYKLKPYIVEKLTTNPCYNIRILGLI